MMNVKQLSKLIIVVGAFLLLHATYSAVFYRKNFPEDRERIPFSILLEAVIGTVVSCVGFLSGQHAFSSILARDHIEQKRISLGVMSSRPNFAVFDHRWSRLARSSAPSTTQSEMDEVVEKECDVSTDIGSGRRGVGDRDFEEDDEEELVIVEPADDPIVPIVMDEDEDEGESQEIHEKRPEVRRRRVADDGSGITE
eukprot:TRINITY_DN10373_c0_g1_i3.p2 TRINITY_DN10373_c0_g1~~TRINITY_DN10373_c0_g1_i3.p2  ORF type:complete len:197 (-),score=59.64 TRINITY_DN10373_c0_g1_i3:1184-1774(-)